MKKKLIHRMMPKQKRKKALKKKDQQETKELSGLRDREPAEQSNPMALISI